MIKPTNYRKDILEKKSDIINWVTEERSKAWICKQLNCHPSTLEKYLEIIGLTYNGNKGGKKYKTNNKYVSALYYINNNLFIGSHILKKKLIKEGIKEAKCERCGNSTWEGHQIPLELHHIDGNHYNNHLDNLKILCPNCHALEDNNSGSANKKKK